MVTGHRVLADTYQDSVKLMQLAGDAADDDGVVTAQAVMATTANKERLREAGLVADAALETAGGNDLVLAVEAADAETVRATLDAMQARHEADGGRRGGAAAGDTETRPRTVSQALAGLSNPAVGLVSVPGVYAVREAWKLLHEGLHVQIFSDGVDLAAERRLKRHGRETGQLVMGPDCGTAIIDGLPLGFANELPQGPVGIVAASGTGLQEVSTLLAGAGYGVSQAIGTGGRDLHDRIGGLTTLAALERLDADAATEVIAVVSKPPGTETAARVREAVRECTTPVVIHFQGDAPPTGGPTGPSGTETGPEANPTERDRERRLETTTTLAETATRIVETLDGASAPQFGAPFGRVDRATFETAVAALDGDADRLVGLFSGGTLCTEAALVLSAVIPDLRTNVAVGKPAEDPLAPTGDALIDLGTDALTRGRPHPMLDPSLRDRQLAAAVEEGVGIVLLDVVLGHGVHDDPVAGIVEALADHESTPMVIASVCGTDGDPQSLADQIDRLEAAGVWVADSNAAAARLAGHARDRLDGEVTG